MPRKASRRERELADARYLEDARQMRLDDRGAIPPFTDERSSIVGGQEASLQRNDPLDDVMACPDCKRVQTGRSGWTVLRDSVRSPALQCGGCGAIVAVTQRAYDAVKAVLEATDPRRIPQAEEKRDRRRVRGAG